MQLILSQGYRTVMVPNQDLSRHKQCEPTVCDVYSTRQMPQMPQISGPHFFDIKAIAELFGLLNYDQSHTNYCNGQEA